MTAIQSYIDTYNRDGYVVVPDVFDPDRAAPASQDMENLFYGMSFRGIYGEVGEGRSICAL